MKRLVYTPRAYVFVKDKNGTIHDLSRYVTSGTIERKLDAVSSARFTIRNPEMIFTTHRDKDGNSVYGPFRPMDPVTIWLRRVKNHPVRVFTGFLDETPFIELFPGLIEFEASCTLKRLQYTYFDAGLPYMTSFLTKYGWIPRGDGSGVFSPTALNEFKLDDPDLTFSGAENQGSSSRDLDTDGVHGSLGQLLFGTMKHIGGWSPDQLIIEPLPGDIFSRLSLLATRNIEQSSENRANLIALFSKIVGEGSFGNGDTQSDVDLEGIDGSVAEQVYKVGIRMGVPENSKLMVSAFMTGIVESKFRNLNHGDADSKGWRQERTSLYPDPTNVPASAKRYFEEGRVIIKASGGQWSGTAGMLAASIQRPREDLRGRYDEERNRALALLRKTATKVGASPDSDQEDAEDLDTTSGTNSKPDQTTRSQKSTKSDSSNDSSGKYYSPIKGLKMSGVGQGGGAYGAPRSYGGHAGVDCAAALGTTLYAITDSVCVYAGSWGSEGQLVLLQTKNNVPGHSGKIVMGYGHMSQLGVEKGASVRGGEAIGKSGAGSNGQPHLHFFIRQDASPANGTMNPMSVITAAVNGEEPSGDVKPTGNTPDTLGSPDSSGIMSAATAASLTSALDLPIAGGVEASRSLGNERALMNDTPLLPFIQQLANASLRHFQSMPDGKFYAFYPDYFGEMKHHEPYWEIKDIEILDGKVRLTDDALMTHSYVVGDTSSEQGGTAMWIRMMLSAGVVTIFNAFTATNPEAFPPPDSGASKKEKEDYEKKREEGEKDADLGANNGLGLGVLMQEDEAIRFLERYGARPNVMDTPMIHSPQFELFLAYQQFMLLWSKQFTTPFTFTFMPELYPGGKVGFPEHGLQMYIEGVTHSWDYTAGFTTSAALSAPSVYGKSSNATLLPENMIRAIIDPAHAEAVENGKQIKSAWNSAKENAQDVIDAIGNIFD